MDAISNHPLQRGGCGRSIPAVFLSPGLRLFFFRLVIAWTLVKLGYTIFWIHDGAFPVWWRDVVGFVFTLVMLIHHIGTAFGPRLFPLIVGTDIALMLIETGWYLSVFAHLSLGLGPGSPFFIETVVEWVLPFGLLPLLTLKIVAIVNTWGTQPMRKRVDIAARGTADPWWRYPTRAVFGIKLWEARIPGEPKPVSILRGLLASFSVVALVAFGWYQTVVLPVSAMERTFHGQCHAALLPPQMYTTKESFRWDLLLVWDGHPNASSHIADAVTATARWDSQQGSHVRPPCNVDRAILPYIGGGHEFAVISCSNLSPSYDGHTIRDPTYWFPNLDLSVNFTGLLGSVELGSTYRRDFDAVRVYVGLSADINIIFQNADPVSLFPGTNMLSVMRPVFRQRIQRAGLATFGFESLDVFMVAAVEQTISNPFMDPPTTRSRNTSTLGLTFQSLRHEWSCIQDYHDKSVLAGLSVIGGLGSFLSTLLVMIAGTSLITAVFRAKPQSPFGLLHSAGSFHKGMAAACDRKYPAFRSDIQEMEKNPGVVAFILDTLIDIEGLRSSDGELGALDPQQEPKPMQTEHTCDEEQPLTTTSPGPEVYEEERECV